MSSLSLYAIAQEHRAMVEALMSTQDDAVAIADTISAESYPLEVKAQATGYAIKTLEANIAAIKQAEKDMADRRRAMENRAQHIRDYLLTCMEIANVHKVECPHFAIAVKKNPPSVDIFEPGLIPDEFLKQPEPPPPVPDKTAIKLAIIDGREVPGAKLSQGKRLDIK
jgi:hypothetical protein